MSAVPARLRVLATRSTDPLLNLAAEDFVLRSAAFPKELNKQSSSDAATLFLWRNAPCVVIGRNQNPHKECHLALMERDGVVLARRHSGGGAVYQDLGNTNFTFVAPVAGMGSNSSPSATSAEHPHGPAIAGGYRPQRNALVVCRGVARASGGRVQIEPKGRNDLVVTSSDASDSAGRKVSGAAYKVLRDRALHHGTLLVGADFTALQRYLNPSKAKLKSKGVASVQARVANLADLDPALSHESVCDGIREEFFAEYDGRCEVEELAEEDLKRIPEVKDTWEKLQDWDWRFGETPDFEHHLETRFDWGTIDVHIDSKDGVITDVKVFSDSLYPDLIEALADALRGTRYDREGVRSALRGVGPGQADLVGEFTDWLVESL
jgi:lipoate---protein ligase